MPASAANIYFTDYFPGCNLNNELAIWRTYFLWTQQQWRRQRHWWWCQRCDFLVENANVVFFFRRTSSSTFYLLNVAYLVGTSRYDEPYPYKASWCYKVCDNRRQRNLDSTHLIFWWNCFVFQEVPSVEPVVVPTRLSPTK